MNPHYGRVAPSEEFDTSMIPVMELLVERGADVNQMEETRHVTHQYAINYALSAGAVERVRWLLEHGANPELRGGWGTAASYAKSLGCEEMQRVVGEGVAARRRVKGSTKTEPT
jgi:ankyrin repeat protein